MSMSMSDRLLFVYSGRTNWLQVIAVFKKDITKYSFHITMAIDMISTQNNQVNFTRLRFVITLSGGTKTLRSTIPFLIEFPLIILLNFSFTTLG